MDGYDGRMRYDLSKEDDTPFQEVKCYMGALDTTCPFMDYQPGQWGKNPVNGCDWRLQPVCNTPNAVVGVLCGRL